MRTRSDAMARTLTAQPEQTIIPRTPGDNTPQLARDLDRITRWGLWLLPVWAVLLFVGTIDHQPDTRTDFAGFARYVTTPEFLASHIVASIIGAAIGVLGLLALFTFLALRVRSCLYTVMSDLGRRLDATVDPAAILPAVAETIARALKP